MTTIEKTISNEIRKWNSFDLFLFHVKKRIKDCYYKISSGDYDSKKNYFKMLHYLKMEKEYIYLKMYKDNIKKPSLNNEKLLCYLGSILVANGFDRKI